MLRILENNGNNYFTIFLKVIKRNFSLLPVDLQTDIGSCVMKNRSETSINNCSKFHNKQNINGKDCVQDNSPFTFY